jgi:hypothetical protein
MLVRLGADYRINPHAPPFKQTPANLFKFNLCSLTPQARHLSVNVHTGINYPTCNAHWFKVRTTRVSNPIWYSYLNGSTSDRNSMPPRPPRIPDNIAIFYLYIIGIANFFLSLVLRCCKWVNYSLGLSYNFLDSLAILYAQ